MHVRNHTKSGYEVVGGSCCFWALGIHLCSPIICADACRHKATMSFEPVIWRNGVLSKKSLGILLNLLYGHSVTLLKQPAHLNTFIINVLTTSHSHLHSMNSLRLVSRALPKAPIRQSVVRYSSSVSRFAVRRPVWRTAAKASYPAFSTSAFRREAAGDCKRED